jgi:hypothetical protein
MALRTVSTYVAGISRRDPSTEILGGSVKLLPALKSIAQREIHPNSNNLCNNRLGLVYDGLMAEIAE